MSPGDEVVHLLMEMDLLTRDDVKGIHAAQSETLLRLLIGKKVIKREQSDDAREVLERMLSTSNRTARAEAQLEFYGLITETLDRRTDEAHEELTEHTKRITSRSWPKIAVEEA